VTAQPPPFITRRSSVTYAPAERALLEDVHSIVDADVERERDAFLCHAWGDRLDAAQEFFSSLTEFGADVWFSERDVQLGRSLARQLDAGLRVSKVGVVLVTPNMLTALRAGGFADQELGSLLGSGRVIPVMHRVTHEQLRNESPLLASRAGLSTEGSSLREVAAKIAEAVLSIEIS
jgi:hypothetical protein